MATATARGTGRRQGQGGDLTRRRLRDRIRYRRDRLLQDAFDLSELFAPHLAVVAFTGVGGPVLFGNPTLHSVLRTIFPESDFGTETAEEAAARVAAMRREARSIEARIAEEQARLRAVAEKVRAAQEEQGRAHWWEVDTEALGEAELPDFTAALDALRADVLRRLRSPDAAGAAPSGHRALPNQVIVWGWDGST